MIIAFYGHMASGKTVAAEHLIDCHGFRRCHHGADPKTFTRLHAGQKIILPETICPNVAAQYKAAGVRVVGIIRPGTTRSLPEMIDATVSIIIKNDAGVDQLKMAALLATNISAPRLIHCCNFIDQTTPQDAAAMAEFAADLNGMSLADIESAISEVDQTIADETAWSEALHARRRQLQSGAA